MPLTFHPRPGAVLMCRYEPGFVKPEMVKRRPVIVIAPRLRHRDKLCAVVPLSGERPNHVEDYHYVLKFAPPLPPPWDAPYFWVKADMVNTVGFHRLDLIRTGRDHEGKRKYLNIRIEPQELKAIQACVLRGLGLGRLTTHL